MSRSVKDLRDLICVSRLTIRSSDDEVVLSDEENPKGQNAERRMSLGRNADIQKSVSEQSYLISTPDSGFGTSGHQASDSQNSDSELALDLPKHRKHTETISDCLKKENLENCVKGNPKKKKTRSRPAQSSVSEQPVLKTSRSRLHSAQKAAGLVKNELFSVSHRRLDTGAVGDRCATPSSDFAEGHFDKLLMFVDGGVVSEWLEHSNRNVAELTAWCHTDDNFVHFAHFWFSQFPDKEKFEIFRLEYTILLDQLAFAFAAGLNSEEIQHRHLSMFLSAVYREYPAKLMSSQGSQLFLNYLDVLSSSKQLQYRQLLSDVRCSTRTLQHIQWILATRSFALVSVWSAVVNFYKTLHDNKNINKISDSFQSVDSGGGIYLHRMYSAISYGYADVVHYFIKSGKVQLSACDKQQKSLVFYAVMYKQKKVLHMLLNQTGYQIDVNLPAINGNTPLHAAANGGNKELVEELLACDRIKIDACNSQCDNATPLHLAILHGHEEIVRLLLSTGADRSMQMGGLTATDIARDFGQEKILDILQEDTA